VALHELSDMGTPENPGSLRLDLDKLGVTPKVEFVGTHSLYRSIFPGLDVTLPAGREEYAGELCRLFPSEAEGIRRFLDRVFSVSKELDELDRLQRMSPKEALPKLATLPFRLRAVPRYMLATWGEVLERDVKDPVARAVISQYWGYFGLPPGKVSFFYFAIALASYVKRGASHIKGRSQALSNAFIERFHELGGESRMGCAVEKIVTKNGAVTGVVTAGDGEINAPVVISNADPVTTCRGLLSAESVPASFWKTIGSMEVGPSSVIVYMGVAKPWESFGVKDHEIFINGSFDMDSHYEAMKRVGPPPALVAAGYNAILPEISPPGTSMVTLTALAFGEPWSRVPVSEYHVRKHEVADAMIRMAGKVFPGLREFAEVVEVATPVTNMRFTGALGGAIYGFSSTPFNHTILRLSAKGPIGGLYFAGAWAQPGGGFSPTIISGKMAAIRAECDLRNHRKRG